MTARSTSDQPEPDAQPVNTVLPADVPSTEPAAAVEPYESPVADLGPAVDPNAPTMQPDPDNVRGTDKDPQRHQDDDGKGGGSKSGGRATKSTK